LKAIWASRDDERLLSLERVSVGAANAGGDPHRFTSSDRVLAVVKSSG
jgi:hypothetical protein